MGMTIEERIAQLVRIKHYAAPTHYETLDVAIDIMRKYQMMQADYEARLKSDMVAMLTEIQLEIENSVRQFRGNYSRGYNTALLDVDRNIQQKIDSLKGRIK